GIRDFHVTGVQTCALPIFHTIDFVGKHFSVRGPLNVPRSPQGRPVIVQAGSSEGGKTLGSRYADAIFTTQTTLTDGQAFYQEMRSEERRVGKGGSDGGR